MSPAASGRWLARKGGGQDPAAAPPLLRAAGELAAGAAVLPLLVFLARILHATLALSAPANVVGSLQLVQGRALLSRDARADYYPAGDPAAAAAAWPVPPVLHVIERAAPPPPDAAAAAAALRAADAAAVESCRRLHPDWAFRAWGEGEGARLLARRYSAAALRNWLAYPFGEQRALALRLFVLHAYGGGEQKGGSVHVGARKGDSGVSSLVSASSLSPQNVALDTH